MRNSEQAHRKFPIWKQRLLVAALLLAFAAPAVRAAQSDIESIRARAERGDAEALNALGNAYANGQGVAQDFAQAIKLYQQAAERGLAAASFNLGMLNELGRGVAANAEAAFRHYLKAAQQGFAPAQFNAGNMYANGIGVKQDFLEAALWFRQAADRGVPEAQYNLALAYELGRGVTKDETTAQRWYREAAGQGYARARYNLALMLEEGRGATADPVAAAELYRAAALQNFAPAQNNFGILLAEGRGVAQNMTEAHAWLSVAVENGARPTGRDIVAQQLSPAQLDESKAAVANLRNQINAAAGSAARVAGAMSAPTAVPAAGPGPTPPPTAAAEAAKPTTGAAGIATAISNLTLDEIAGADPRIANLLAERTRLNEEVKRSTIELAQMNRQLRAQAERPAAGPAAATPPKPDPATDQKLADVTRQLREQQTYADKLEQTNAQLNDRLTALSEERDRLVAAARLPARTDAGAAQAQQQLTEAGRQREALAAEKAVLERTIADLNRRFGEQQTFAQKLEEANTRLGADVTALRAERDKLGQSLQQATDAAASANDSRNAEAVRQRDTVATEKAALERRLAEVNQRLVDQQTALDQLQQANARLTKELTGMKTEREKLVAASEQNSAAQAKAVQAQQALSDSAKLREMLTTERNSLRQRLGELSGQLAEQQSAVQKLEAANSDLKTRLASAATEADKRTSGQPGGMADQQTLDKLTAQLDSAGRTIAELNARNDSLQKDLEVARQSAAAALAAQAAVANAAPGDALKLELQTVQEQVRSLEAQLDSDRKSSAQELASLAAQLQSSRESNRAMAEANRVLMQVKGSEDSAAKSATDSLKSQLAAARADLEKVRTTQAGLAADLVARTRELADARTAATGPAQERDSLRAQVEQLFGRANAAEQKLAEQRLGADAAKAEADRARSEVAAMQARFAEASRAAEQQGSSVAELTGLNDKLSNDKAALEKQVTQLRQAAEVTKTELATVKSRLNANDRVSQEQLASINELTAANEKLEGQAKDLNAQITSLRSENSRLASATETTAALRAELSEARAKLTDAQKATEEHGGTVAELTSANEKLTNELRAVQGQLATLRNENGRLAQSEQARQDAERRVTSLANTATQLTATQRELSAARAEIARLTDSVQALDRDRTARVTLLQQENAAISARLRQAQGTLEQIASAARVLNGVAAPAGAVAASSTAVPTIPIGTVPAPAAASRTHVVAEGDSLTRISMRYYGTGTRWQDIYDANRDLLRGENSLRPGQRLRIP